MADRRLRVALMTREFPPHVYGGAGVHVDFLSRELEHLVDLQVMCAGEPRANAQAFSERDPRFPGANPALHVLKSMSLDEKLELLRRLQGDELADTASALPIVDVVPRSR